MAHVIERKFGDGNGFVDIPSTYEDATILAGRKLDRRKNYAIFDGMVHELLRYTMECSGCGCDCGDDYPCGHGAGGCQECGYTGRTRVVAWEPLDQYHTCTARSE